MADTSQDLDALLAECKAALGEMDATLPLHWDNDQELVWGATDREYPLGWRDMERIVTLVNNFPRLLALMERQREALRAVRALLPCRGS